MKTRKELAVGGNEHEAIAHLNETKYAPFDYERFEIVRDEVTNLFSVFHRRKATDKTVKRPITRESREPYSNGYGKDRRKIVVTLLPRELIETRLKGTRRRYSITWDALHAYLVRRDALAVMRAKQAERAARRKNKFRDNKRKR